MNYLVKRIQNATEIETCERFEIATFLWNSKQNPKTYGWLGYIEGVGFYAKMVCEESNPRRVYTNDKDPVYKDSTVEVFLAFLKENETLSNDCMYTNFEFNSNAALLASYGEGRYGREFLSDEHYAMTNCKTAIHEDYWTAEVTIPETFLYSICDFDAVKAGKTFYCNFYKISETDDILHFGAYSPIDTPGPNFHVPVCFAEATIERK